MATTEDKKELSPSLSKVWDDLVSKVENNPGVWSKPWFVDPVSHKIMRPYNPITKRNYHGYNLVHLEISRITQGYMFNQWCTFNQCKAAGGFVKKGEKGTPIIVFVPPKKKIEKDEKTGEEIETQTGSAFFSYTVVFNISQTTLKPEDLPEIPAKNYTIPEVEALIAGTGAVITHDYQDRAYYSPSQDKISLPLESQFKSLPDYYETKFHELIHWTGNAKRLNRLSAECFGSDKYAREELVAEIGAVFLKAETGINNETDNAAAYIKNWWGKIKEDRGSLITAAGQAEKALTFILNSSKKTEA